jgi:hypothetical protein
MWLYNFIELFLMSLGCAIGAFAWASAFAGDYRGPYWWAGGLIGLAVGWIIPKCVMQRAQNVPPAAVPTPAAQPKQQPKQTPAPKPARSEAITLLATLQREARFVDFIQESLAGYTDAQIGAVARDVHRDCGTALKRLFDLRPAVGDEEGTEVVVPTGFDPARWRLTGKVAGEPPFRGRLVHPGWEATQCELPTWSGSAAAARIVAPGEVEVQ